MSGVYKDGELLAQWRKEAKDSLMKHHRRLKKAGESCESYKEGNPGDYARSMLIMADYYLKAAACFDAAPCEVDAPW